MSEKREGPAQLKATEKGNGGSLPELVPLEPKQVMLEDGTGGILLRDPYGVLSSPVVVTPPVYFVLAHFDGHRDAPAVVRALETAGLLGVRIEDVGRIAEQAKRAGLVFGPEYEALRSQALSAYRAGPRLPACAGTAYPDDETELHEMLAGFCTHSDGPGARNGHSRAGLSVRLLVAPHIDFRRGGPAYAHAYRKLEGSDAELYVVFGTAHASPRQLYTLTRQDFETPLGPVATDRTVVDALASELPEDELFTSELVHVHEHSCEFQMVWLRWILGDRPFRVVAVLCSSISHLQDPAGATAPFLAALARATAGRKVCYVAGADFAHVGPQYGDAQPPTPEQLGALRNEDQRTLAFLSAGDTEGFHRHAVADEKRRLCGVAPIYAAMRASGRGARLLHYSQWTDGSDMVSFAAAAG
ncbi:MAG TPA: AmmeMemoRadiSam system protein B [Anaeromyxobacteraceae bacterium]|nr:AmmeMemoRadiSam system protein B [Anaeromyxobacteraceae bacterium]